MNSQRSNSSNINTVIGDRFIPYRESRFQEFAVQKLNYDEVSECNTHHSYVIKQFFQNKDNILAYNRSKSRDKNQIKQNSNQMKDFIQNNFMFDMNDFKIQSKKLPLNPERVLDAPRLFSDFYFNLVDWGNHGIIAIALRIIIFFYYKIINEGKRVYLYDNDNGQTEELSTVNNSLKHQYICSVKWMNQSKSNDCLAIGFCDNIIQLWDSSKKIIIRNLKGHVNKVISLSWSNHILSSGGYDSFIINHDIRVQQHIISRFNGHSTQVCGLKWSKNGNQLASGSQDQKVMIWSLHNQTTPLFTFTQHKSSVKVIYYNQLNLQINEYFKFIKIYETIKSFIFALDWCPYNNNILVTGGGADDHKMCFWNTLNGKLLDEVKTDSQISSILWSTNTQEIVIGHGNTKKLSFWNYPNLELTGDIMGHKGRILNICLSPNGQQVLTVAGDEKLRFWKVFEKKIETKKENNVFDKESPFTLR